MWNCWAAHPSVIYVKFHDAVNDAFGSCTGLTESVLLKYRDKSALVKFPAPLGHQY